MLQSSCPIFTLTATILKVENQTLSIVGKVVPVIEVDVEGVVVGKVHVEVVVIVVVV